MRTFSTTALAISGDGISRRARPARRAEVALSTIPYPEAVAYIVQACEGVAAVQKPGSFIAI